MSRIFVHIAAYRDPECQHTINDLLRQASRPEKISVGLVQQVMPGDATVPASGHVRSIQVDAHESQGTCWVRNLGYTLYQGEDFILQIDSHMRFATRWDEKMLAELAACPSEKPMLTAYVPGYEPPDTIVNNSSTALRPQAFNASGCLLQYGRLIYNLPSEPSQTFLISGHLMFARGQWIHEVPYDPYLYHTGEETTLVVRLWIHGWDLCNPRQALVWHQYTRQDQPRHWNDYPEKWALVSRGHQRALHLLGMAAAPAEALVNLGTYGFGTVRTLSDYQLFSGIDFKQRTITEHALEGRVIGEWIGRRAARYQSLRQQPSN